FGGFDSDGSVFTVADEFRFTKNALIGSLSWWGGYANPPPGPDSFSLQLFNDAGGHPGILLAGFQIGSIQKVATGNFVNPGAHPDYQYSAALQTPFLAEANVTYWLSI